VGSARVQASGLCKWYGPVVALNDLGFAVQAPVVGLLGPNGAGKSTLLKLLCGQLRPSKGEVRLLGEAPWDNRRLMARLGYCPEHDRFYEDMPALEFVALLTRLHGFDSPDAARLARAALAEVELEEVAARPIRALSHGMRQRLKLAQALAHGPEALVLDEPLSGLDPLQRARVIELLRRLGDRGVSVLISSHVLHELEAMTDHILLLSRGRMLAQGAVGEVRALIDAHPHRIALEAARPRELGRELLSFEDVVRVELEGARVVIETRSPDTCYERIGELAASGAFGIRAMLSLDDNMEAVFRYLVQPEER